MNIRITDKGGLKPTFTQWDVDRVLLISGCDSQPSLRFDNPELSRSIVVVAEADGADWKCNVPNFMLQFSGPMIVSVFIQPDEGKTVFTARYNVAWAKKPQDYTYEENIGYTNWVQKTEEAQELLDDIEDLRDEIQTAAETATSASEAAVAAAEDIDETVAAALQEAKDSGDFDGADGQDGQDGAPGPKGDAGEDGVSPTVTVSTITGGHRLSISAVNGDYEVDVMDGAPGPQGETGPQGPSGAPGAKGDKGDDGQDATVDATLSNAGEAADAAATGAVKVTADRVSAETLAMWPRIGGGELRWIYGSYINTSGAVRTNYTNYARSNLFMAKTGDIVQNLCPAKVSVSGADKNTAFTLHEYSFGTGFDNASGWLRRTVVPAGEYVTIGKNTNYIQVVFGLNDTSIVLANNKTLLTDNFAVRIAKACAEAQDVEELMPQAFPSELDMPLAVCHRGLASADKTGNTIAAYEDAIAKGWKYLECDIRHTSDDVWVLHHDADISGTNISEMTYAQAIAADANLATLEDFLLLCRRALVTPVVENKLGSSTTNEEADAVWALAKNCGMEKEIIWLCSSFGGVQRWLELNPYASVINTSANAWNGVDMSDPSSLSRPDAFNYMTGKNKVFHQRIASAVASGQMDNLVDFYHYWGIYCGVYGPTSQAGVDALSERLDIATTEVCPYTKEPRPTGGGVSSVNGQTGAVTLSIPSTASDVGAVAVAQGVSHAGEFVVVGSDGNVTTVTMTAWQGGNY